MTICTDMSGKSMLFLWSIISETGMKGRRVLSNRASQVDNAICTHTLVIKTSVIKICFRLYILSDYATPSRVNLLAQSHIPKHWSIFPGL